MEVLYDDLENYDDSTAFEELKKENIELKLKLEENVIALQKLQKEFDFLGHEFKLMQLNYSSLLKTAREEIKRKTDQITQLNQEKDAMVLKSLQNGTNIRRNFRGHSPRGRNRSSNREFMSKNSKLESDERKASIYEPKTERYDSSVAQNKVAPALSSNNSSTSTLNTHSTNLLRLRNDDIDRAKERVDAYEAPKPRSIRDRRKSMPALERLSDENLRYDPPDRQQERFIDRHNYKGSETSSIDRNYNNHDPRSNVDRHYDRGRDKYDVSYRHRSRFSPEKYRRPDREYMEDYHRRELIRHREPPPDTYTHYQHRNHDNRLSYETEKYRENEKIASKHKIPSDYEESQAKRQRIEHADKHPQFVDRRNKCNEKIVKQSVFSPEFLEASGIYDTCQSPDITNPDAPNHPIKEIKLDPVEKLPDPRKASNKYTSKAGNNTALTSVSSSDIRIKPIDKSIWNGDKVAVKVPEALKHNPFQISEDLAKEIYMDIDNPGQISPESDFMSNDSTLVGRSVSHMLDKIASETDDIRNEKEYQKDSLDDQSKVCKQDLQTNTKENKNQCVGNKIPEENIRHKNFTKNEIKETKVVSENKINAIEKIFPKNQKIKKSPKDSKIVGGDSAKSQNVTKIDLAEIKNILDTKKDVRNKHEVHNEVKENKKLSKDSKINVTTPEAECVKHKNVPKLETAGTKNVSKDNNVEIITSQDMITKKSKTEKSIEDKNTTPTEESDLNKKHTTKNSHRTTKSNNKTSPIEKSSKSIRNASKSQTIVTPNFIFKREGCISSIQKPGENLENRTSSKSDIELVEGDLELSDDTSDHIDTNRELTDVSKSKHRTKTNCKGDTKHSQKCDSNKNKVKTVKKEKVKDVVDSNKKHSNKKRKDSEQNSESTIKDLSKGDNKSKSKNLCKSSDKRSKLSELFGESSSLITPEDLGFPMFGPPPDDAQDAVDIDIHSIKTQQGNVTNNKEIVENEPSNTELAHCIRDGHVVEKPTKTADSDAILAAKNSIKSVPKIITSNSDDIPYIEYENLNSENKTNDQDVVKTVIISTGIQPQFLDEDKDVNKLIQVENNSKAQPLTKHFELNALATSTPHKDFTECKAEETCSNKVKNLEHSASDVQNDAPDVRIFVKRRKRVMKKAPNS